MSQNEWNNAWESLQKVLIIYVPYMVASMIVSVCGYIERHWKKEPFSLAKLITGLVSDMVYGMTLVFGALWLSRNNHICAMFVLFVGLARGRKWADDLIDKILWQRYGQGGYGGYSNDMYEPQFPQQNNIETTQGDDPGNGNKNNHNGSQELDPRE